MILISYQSVFCSTQMEIVGRQGDAFPGFLSILIVSRQEQKQVALCSNQLSGRPHVAGALALEVLQLSYRLREPGPLALQVFQLLCEPRELGFLSLWW